MILTTILVIDHVRSKMLLAIVLISNMARGEDELATLGVGILA